MKARDLRKYLYKNLNQFGRHVKYFGAVGASENGIPDIHVCFLGKYFAIELKAGTDTLSGMQTEVLREYSEAGAETYVIKTKEQIDNLIEYMFSHSAEIA